MKKTLEMPEVIFVAEEAEVQTASAGISVIDEYMC